VAVLLELTRCDRNLSYTFKVSIRARLGGKSAPFADRHYRSTWIYTYIVKILGTFNVFCANKS